MLSQEGMFSIIIPVQKSTGELIGLPEIITRGFIYIKDSDELLREAKQFALESAGTLLEKCPGPDWTAFIAAMKTAMKTFLHDKTKRTPIIVPIVVDIEC